MADSEFLEREYDALFGGQSEAREESGFDEAEEHRRRMAAKFEELCAQPVDYAKYSEQARESYFSSERGDHPRYTEYETSASAPSNATVSAPADAPSAQSRIRDYMESARRLDEMRRESPVAGALVQEAPEMAMDELQAPEAFAPAMISEVQAPAMMNEMQAPAMGMAAQNFVGEPQFAAPRDEYMGWLYQQGIVQSQELAPPADVPVSTMPFHEFNEENEDDAKPTSYTMKHLREEDETVDEEDVRVTSALSSKTKIVLCAIAATIMILLAIICINAAVIRSLNADVSYREQTVTDLGATLRSIESEIDEMTSPEYVENWAAEHGMTPPES